MRNDALDAATVMTAPRVEEWGEHMRVSRACLATLVFLVVIACSSEKQEITDRGPADPTPINLDGPPRRTPIVINLDDPPRRSPIKIDLDDTPKRSVEYEAGRLALKRNDYDTAIVHLRSAAEAGEAAAQSDLGVLILRGYGTTEPPQNAEAWFLKAAEQNERYAQMNLGLLYLQGVVPRNCDAAITWLHKAAESAVPDAGFELGRLYYFGECVPKDRERSAAWRLRAAELGHVGAQVRLARMYGRGDGVPRDLAEQAKWLSKAAEKQDPSALWFLGMVYTSGNGVTKDDGRGIDLLWKAHEQGNACATITLAARLFEGGSGVRRDASKARQLLQSPNITAAQRDVMLRVDFSNPTSRASSERELRDLFVSLDCL